MFRVWCIIWNERIHLRLYLIAHFLFQKMALFNATIKKSIKTRNVWTNARQGKAGPVWLTGKRLTIGITTWNNLRGSVIQVTMASLPTDCRSKDFTTCIKGITFKSKYNTILRWHAQILCMSIKYGTGKKDKKCPPEIKVPSYPHIKYIPIKFAPVEIHQSIHTQKESFERLSDAAIDSVAEILVDVCQCLKIDSASQWKGTLCLYVEGTSNVIRENSYFQNVQPRFAENVFLNAIALIWAHRESS